MIEEAEEICTPPEVQDIANAARHSILPNKSREHYEIAYKDFKIWMQQRNVQHISENIVLAYLKYESEKKAPSTLWALYSMIKSMINFNHNIDILSFQNIKAFLKNVNKGYVRKKASVFTETQISQFLNNAPDQIYLATKVSVSEITLQTNKLSCQSIHLYVCIIISVFRSLLYLVYLVCVDRMN